jgi:hypothetical protein
VGYAAFVEATLGEAAAMPMSSRRSVERDVHSKRQVNVHGSSQERQHAERKAHDETEEIQI